MIMIMQHVVDTLSEVHRRVLERPHRWWETEPTQQTPVARPMLG